MLPTVPPGMKMAREKKAFQRQTKMGKDHQPHTGQIATRRLMTATRPTTAPIDTSLGLYSSMFLASEILGMMKEEKIMRLKMMV